MSKQLKIAVSQLGVCEQPQGSNKGAEVDEYLAAVGIHQPSAWCAAFAVWCHQQAGITIPKTGGVLDLYNKSPEQRVKNPEPGDLFIQDHGGGKGHTGFIESVDGDALTTIEGNTNDDGVREGYEVARRTRSASKMKGFLRFT